MENFPKKTQNFKNFPDFKNVFGKAGRARECYHVERILKFGRPYYFLVYHAQCAMSKKTPAARSKVFGLSECPV